MKVTGLYSRPFDEKKSAALSSVVVPASMQTAAPLRPEAEVMPGRSQQASFRLLPAVGPQHAGLVLDARF